MKSKTLRGLTTVTFYADDVKAARIWYSDLLGITPYFALPDADNPAYIEFRVGDYQHELGIADRRYAPKDAPDQAGGAVIYWHVDNIQATFERLLSMGAKEYEPIIERGEGFVTASVTDPFGNVLGIMYNLHYLGVLESMQTVNQNHE
jgi:predicted enzyme related to lactoylglutathione lyase